MANKNIIRDFKISYLRPYKNERSYSEYQRVPGILLLFECHIGDAGLVLQHEGMLHVLP